MSTSRTAFPPRPDADHQNQSRRSATLSGAGVYCVECVQIERILAQMRPDFLTVEVLTLGGLVCYSGQAAGTAAP